MENNRNNEQTQHKKKSTSFNKGEDRVGRAGHEETHDISHVDRQEGAMDHGVLGGNFSVEENADLTKNDKNNNK